MNLHRSATVDAPRLLLAGAGEAADEGIVAALVRAGFRCDRRRDAHDLAAALRGGTWDAVLLGGAAAAGAGLPAVLAAQPATVAVLLLADSTAADRIRWLEQGVDELVALPADPDEVAARVRAALRRVQRVRAAAVELRHGPLCLETERRVATWHGREVPLTHREFRLLEALLRRRHEVVSRSALEQVLYGWNEESNSNAVEVHVHHLRRKFDRRLIVTLRGSGYRLGATEGLSG